jgi:acyl-CoA synthetase (NDP forming)/RimJ/RimL family protein N-acetyltransferase
MTTVDRSADVLLTDGTTVHLRPIEPDDADAIVAMHSRFSERTRYLRYFSPYPRIPERDLHRFVTVDHHEREAFVVESGGRLIAVGRYDRLGPDSPEAEVAFVVEDAHQGRGIGSVLIEHLAEAARTEGIKRFVAEVLPVNAAMLRVFADFGYQVQRQYADGVVHLSFPIEPTEQSREVQWRREHHTEARSIARLLAPRGAAVYGASSTGYGAGAAILGHLRDGGFRGVIVPVHPTAARIAGIRAHSTAAEAGVPLDVAVVAVPPPAAPAVVADAAAAGVHGLVVVSAGFAEAGPEGAVAERELLRSARAAGMRVVGPNCLGIANTADAVRLNATLAPRLPTSGRVGFFSQSGPLGVTLLAEGDRRGLGLSSFVSAGNRADVSGNDLLQYWQDDPTTDVVLLYLETFGNPRKFARLTRRIGRSKPLVVLAPFEGLAQATDDGIPPGGPDAAAVTGLFERSGVIRVDTVAELFDVGILLAKQPLPAGRRTGIVGNSSALVRLAAAACRVQGMEVAPGHPADIGPRADAHVFADVLATTAADPEVDAVLVVAAPALPGQPADAEADLATVLAGVALAGDKPVAVAATGTAPPGLPTYPSVEEAVRALARVARYAGWLRRPPGVVPELSNVDRVAADAALALGGTGMAERVLAAYGVPLVPSASADAAEGVREAATRLGYPVALKSSQEGLRHRLDLGAVRLDLGSEDELNEAYDEMARRFGPVVLVQPMVAPGVACVVETDEHRTFGPVVGFGLGGVATDLLGDRAWRAAPLTDRDAAELVDEPRAAPLLRGYRGVDPVDRYALADLLLRVGRLVDEHPQVQSLRLNPMLARPDGLSVLHADVRVGPVMARPDSGPRRL